MKTPAKASTLFMLACSTLVIAQLSAQTAVHHTHPHTATKPAACAPAAAAPVLPPGVPPAAGTVKDVFALRYIDTQVGTGAPAETGDYMTVHYTGWLASTGMKFDSSLDRGQPITFQQGSHRVIPGWDQGFAGMHVGGKRRLFIPYQLAYGDAGRQPIPPKGDLIFDIELVAAGATPPDQPPAPDAPAKPAGAPSR